MNNILNKNIDFSGKVCGFVSEIQQNKNIDNKFLKKICDFVQSWVDGNKSNPAVAQGFKDISAEITTNAEHFSDKDNAAIVADEIKKAAESIFFPAEIIKHIIGFADPATFINMKSVCKGMDKLAFEQIIPAINSRRLPIKDFGFNTIDQVIKLTEIYGQKIQCLNLTGYKGLTNDQLETIVKNCPNLKYLKITNGAITDAGLAHLAALTSLQKLVLNECVSITDAGLVHLKALTSLQSLDLSWCDEITDVGLAHLAALKSLQSLNLSYCEKITGAGLAHLAALTSLHTLYLSYCEKITDSGLAHLAALTSLHTLSLWNCKNITDAGLAHLAALTSLHTLYLSWCGEITDAGLAHLKALTSLQKLDLLWCGKITDAGLVHLKALTSLQSLNLSWCGEITDAGLAHLKALTSLQKLDLLWCGKITDAGLAELKKSLPNLRVVK